MNPVTRECEKEIIQTINRFLNEIPWPMRARARQRALNFLRSLPPCARGYTLQQLIEVLERAGLTR